jgi:uncharacterized protein (DUF849 family)
VLDAETYRAALAAVRRETGERVVIQASTEAVGRYAPLDQIAFVRELIPEAVSLAVRELVPDPESERPAAELYAWLEREGIGVQHILYSADDVRRFSDLRRRGVVPGERAHALFVLGRYAALQESQPRDLLPFLEEWPAESPWSLCAFGAAEASCIALAIALGGHARAGFENNLLLPGGGRASSNADLIANAAALARRCGRSIATPAQARAVYGTAAG